MSPISDRDPAGLAQAGTVECAVSGDLGCDPAGPEYAPVLVEVVTAVGEEPAEPVTEPATQSAEAGYEVQQ